jgi:hypothetical protein
MTNRINPEILRAPESDYEIVAATDGTPEAIHPLVREWNDKRRNNVVAEMVGRDVATFVAHITSVQSAPHGVDPAETLTTRIEESLAGLATIVVGAREHLSTFNVDDSDLVATFGALLTRATPASAEIVTRAAATKKGASGEKRTRQAVARIYKGASGTYRTPGIVADGRAPGQIKLTVKGDVPTFTTSDGSKFGSATSALRHEDGWGARSGGWGNPFDVCTAIAVPGHEKGATLGACTKA